MIQFSLADILNFLAQGALWTLILTLIAFVSGGICGFGILMLRCSQNSAARALTKLYIEFFQGTPLLMQLFLIFFGIGLFGIDVSPLLAATLGLTAFTSAFLAEIWRGCVESIGFGQWEASASLAMSRWQQMRYVILPQAVRLAIPQTVGFSVQVVKGTALASIIGFTEITKSGSMLANATYKPMLIYGLVAIGYFLMCYPLSLAAKHYERKFHVSARH